MDSTDKVVFATRFVATLLVLLSFPSRAQQPATQDAAQSVIDAFNSAGKSHTGLPGFEQLTHISATSDAASRFRDEMKATLSAELGDYELALSEVPYSVSNKAAIDKPNPLPKSGLQPEEAADAIVRLARDRRIVIINEAHHVPQTRALIAELLPRLRAVGFTDYSAEALTEEAPRGISARGYPLRSDGIYTREPVFAQLLRSAAGLGFRIHAHEYVGSESEQQVRETGQAENLARLLRKNPNGRLLVHVGYSHVKEGPLPTYIPMAAELKRLAGIDPLTVDQVMLQPNRPTSRELPDYRALLKRLPPDRLQGSVFVDSAGNPWSYEPSQYDISVVLPDPPAKDGRPGWLWQPMLQRHPVLADPALCDDVFPCAIAARWADAPDDAVAADMVLLRGAGTRTSLAVPPGHFTLVATDAQDRLLGRRDVTQAAP